MEPLRPLRALPSLAIALGLAGIAACGAAADAPPSLADGGTGPTPVVEAGTPALDGGARPDDAAPDAAGPPPCERAPCPERPVVFVHGFRGSNDDYDAMLADLVAEDPRWDSFRFSGTEDHAAWATRSIPRRSWLFAFDYYVAKKEDARGSYTAGPGRIGSDRGYTCASPAGAGRVLSDSADYAAGVTHEYGADLAAMIADVLRATGASSVDVVAHSMGGLVTRSYLTFHGGAKTTKNLLLLASPWDGVGAVGLAELVGIGEPEWMKKHEIAELDAGSAISQVRFLACGEAASAKGSWPDKLYAAERALAPFPEVYVMSAQLDVLVSYDSAHHPRAKTHDVVPGATHGGMLSSREAVQRVRAVTGGAWP